MSSFGKSRIRDMTPDDAERASVLFTELGYPGSAEEVRRRLPLVNQWPDQKVFVAEVEGAVVGICHVHGVRLLNTDGYAEIATLVVAQSCHRQGVGAELVAQAVSWAGDHGYDRVRLRTGLHREAAHRFYEACKFVQKRASYAYELEISGRADTA
jgi:GNAT superfamily N-acetyltransferase